jgi:hypothetical protein
MEDSKLKGTASVAKDATAVVIPTKKGNLTFEDIPRSRQRHLPSHLKDEVRKFEDRLRQEWEKAEKQVLERLTPNKA